MNPAQRLQEVLDHRDEEMQSLIEEVKEEADRLEAEAWALRKLIERAEGGSSAAVTLHEAMARVLWASQGNAMSAQELADAVHRAGLYRRRDGSPVDAAQIHARARNYSNLFQKGGSGIGMRHDYATSEAASSGAYEARLVTITDRQTGDSMKVEVRISYTAMATNPRAEVDELAKQKARDLVAKGRFEAGTHTEMLLTTSGWVEADEG